MSLICQTIDVLKNGVSWLMLLFMGFNLRWYSRTQILISSYYATAEKELLELELKTKIKIEIRRVFDMQPTGFEGATHQNSPKDQVFTSSKPTPQGRVLFFKIQIIFHEIFWGVKCNKSPFSGGVIKSKSYSTPKKCGKKKLKCPKCIDFLSTKKTSIKPDMQFTLEFCTLKSVGKKKIVIKYVKPIPGAVGTSSGCEHNIFFVFLFLMTLTYSCFLVGLVLVKYMLKTSSVSKINFLNVSIEHSATFLHGSLAKLSAMLHVSISEVKLQFSKADTQSMLQVRIAFWIANTAKPFLTGNLVSISCTLGGSINTALKFCFYLSACLFLCLGCSRQSFCFWLQKTGRTRSIFFHWLYKFPQKKLNSSAHYTGVYIKKIRIKFNPMVFWGESSCGYQYNWKGLGRCNGSWTFLIRQPCVRLPRICPIHMSIGDPQDKGFDISWAGLEAAWSVSARSSLSSHTCYCIRFCYIYIFRFIGHILYNKLSISKNLIYKENKIYVRVKEYADEGLQTMLVS
ncbi:hypothetical protein VP01_1522g3 [Puccinia sorghi]|uniref:Uncharacterized protein n=1 Tax=Puccinia sorghi TaxID=27349 RepID=A0A0L6VIX9_9BASI|nr:hypothetical protein VP01_1522g3 [Puccinia sorghi]